MKSLTLALAVLVAPIFSYATPGDIGCTVLSNGKTVEILVERSANRSATRMNVLIDGRQVHSFTRINNEVSNTVNSRGVRHQRIISATTDSGSAALTYDANSRAYYPETKMSINIPSLNLNIDNQTADCEL